MSNSGQNSSGVYNSGQYFQSQGQQNVPRYANVSQTMMSGNTGESPQIQFIDTRAGPTPMVLQVSPQNQAFRHVDIRQMPAPSD
jgi:hypothetical protein